MKRIYPVLIAFWTLLGFSCFSSADTQTDNIEELKYEIPSFSTLEEGRHTNVEGQSVTLPSTWIATEKSPGDLEQTALRFNDGMDLSGVVSRLAIHEDVDLQYLGDFISNYVFSYGVIEQQTILEMNQRPSLVIHAKSIKNEILYFLVQQAPGDYLFMEVYAPHGSLFENEQRVEQAFAAAASMELTDQGEESTLSDYLSGPESLVKALYLRRPLSITVDGDIRDWSRGGFTWEDPQGDNQPATSGETEQGSDIKSVNVYLDDSGAYFLVQLYEDFNISFTDPANGLYYKLIYDGGAGHHESAVYYSPEDESWIIDYPQGSPMARGIPQVSGPAMEVYIPSELLPQRSFRFAVHVMDSQKGSLDNTPWSQLK